MKAHNEAIQLMWLKSYLNLGPSCLTWAFVTDMLINWIAPTHINDLTKMNIFLQTWNILLQGTLRANCPPGTTSEQPLTDSLSQFTDATAQPSHKNTSCCRCAVCKTDHACSCANPNKCTKEAQKILLKLHPKFCPIMDSLPDGLTLTHRHKTKNAQARPGIDVVIFDPTISCKTSLAECFQVFADPSINLRPPAMCLMAPQGGVEVDNELLTFYTDSSCTNNGKANARCGAGIWVAEGHPLNRSIRIAGPHQSNQVGELII
ncbi:hypothetical protein EWM64_g10399 [Hericium alpestre]|uniref:RNase H type-1 domain-containing protein n=1 Tax=Hericium alpestre TaxID=135208 RepID=A0A4Y9ZGS3_9AGAM|nr:hypothetical protein EWM64_g10399 [Hericium alpestre]